MDGRFIKMIDDWMVIAYPIVGILFGWMFAFFWFVSRIGNDDTKKVQDSRSSQD